MENKSAGAELVEKGLAVIKMENDSLMQMAIQRPRDEMTIFKKAKDELEMYPEFASTMWYSISYKNHVKGCRDRKNCGCPKKPVEGPSIKAAMSLSRRWGNCSSTGRILNETDDQIIIEGVFIDYESSTRNARPIIIKKGYWDRYKKEFVRVDIDEKLLQSSVSKAIRNAIIASLPKPLVDSYIKEAKRIAAKPKSGESPISKLESIKERFIDLGVTAEQYSDYINGLTVSDDKSLIEHLIGLGTAIVEGRQKIEDIFTIPEATVVNEGQVSMSDVMGGKDAK